MQQPMHHGTTLGVVDGLTPEHGVAVLGQAGLAGQFHQQGFGGGVGVVFGQVSEHTGRLLTQCLNTLHIGCKSGAQIKTGKFLGMLLQILPGGGQVTTHRLLS